MFGPKHTFESVAKDLVYGFERGTIVLHPAEPTEADIKNFELMVKARLATYRRTAIGLWVVAALLVTTPVLLLVILFPKDQSLAGFPYSESGEFAILSFFAGMVMGHLFALTHKRSVELKTFIQILKMADATTARRLVLWKSAKLREEALVP
jgi:hypothetical protein